MSDTPQARANMYATPEAKVRTNATAPSSQHQKCQPASRRTISHEQRSKLQDNLGKHAADDDDGDGHARNEGTERPASLADHSAAGAGRVRTVKLHHDGCTKLGFSLRGGKEAARSPVGVLVSHVELRSEADKKGLKVGDLLLQVNGLDVNQATYEEVIELIKRTPKRQDVVLKVTNLGRVPYQENPGAPIVWIKVNELINTSNSLSPSPTDNGSSAEFKCLASSLISSSDEGIESYSYSSGSTNPGSCQQVARQVALTSRDTESICSSSGAGDSISSNSSLTIGACITLTSSSDDDDDEGRADGLAVIRVPGGRSTNEPFGCDVVKGLDEWPGIFVQSVKQASLAQRCGLQLGDQLVRADGVHLQGMSFEAAIQLIKRLQQQQDEMLLHVKKGAALRHLASRQHQHRAEASNGRVSSTNGYQHNSKSAPAKVRCDSSDSDRASSSSGSSSGEWAPNGAMSSSQKLISTNNEVNSKKLAITGRRSPQPLRRNEMPARENHRPADATDCNLLKEQQSVNDRPESSGAELGQRPPSEKFGGKQQSISSGRQKQKAGEFANRRRDEEQHGEEEIRIVSQSCKLHPHHPQSGLSQSQVLDKFPHPAARLQQQVAPPTGRYCDKQQQPAAGRKRQTTTVDEMRRKLEPQCQRSPAQKVQRFKSMDNLAQCPYIAQQPAATRQPPRPPRSSSVSRQQQEFNPLATEQRGYLLSRRPQDRRIYRRSASVLGQPMNCCPVVERQQDETLRYMAGDYARLSVPLQQCCSLVRQQRQRQQIYSEAAGANLGGQYGSNTLLSSPPRRLVAASGPMLFAGGCRAQSMDRLNINLNYLKIGLQASKHYPVRPTHPKAAAGAKQRALAASRQHCLQARPLVAAAAASCCIQEQQTMRRVVVPSSECRCDRLSIASRSRSQVRVTCDCPCCPRSAMAMAPPARIVRYASQLALESGAEFSSSTFNSGQSTCHLDRPRERSPRKVGRAPQPPAVPMFARVAANNKPAIQSSVKPKRLTTFQSASQQQPSDESSAYSQSYFSTSSSSSSSSSDGSQATSLSTCESSSPVGLASTLGRPELLGHQPRSSSPLPQPPPTTTAATTAKRAPPRPPPMPASGESLGTASGCKLVATASSNNHHRQQTDSKQQQRPRKSSSSSDNDQPDVVAGGSNDATDKQQQNNRLCFVDELKMLAKRQQEEEARGLAGSRQQATGSSGDHSSTLIKIINASKSAKGCACDSRGAAAQQQQWNANCCSPQKQPSNCNKCNQVKLCKLDPPAKSVKLSEEDNKRRQHEMLMKEFKSAHSRMFNKRREGTTATSPCLEDSTTCQQTGDAAGEAQAIRQPKASVAPSGPSPDLALTATNRTTIKTITTKKTNLMAQTQQVHLAAAN